MNEKWFDKSYRRNLIDMHIEDWDDNFLSEFESVNYVELLKNAKVQSAMVYAQSHVGYCYWPVKTGYMHRNLKGRDIFGEVVELCHKEGMDVIAYYSLIYNNWAYETYLSWRMLDMYGKGARVGEGNRSSFSRYGLCCPNNKEYRKFAIAQLQELCSGYDFDGIFLDMTFWPMICYCDSCKARYAEEIGGEIPTVVDWRDPIWITYQKKRQEWLTEFADFTASAIKKVKPDVAVEHQFSSSVSNWIMGSSEKISEASDYTGGDFYGGFQEQSFICKLFYSLTNNMPFEYMTAFGIGGLDDHTAVKSREELETHIYLALAHGGASLVIDAIDPVGTLNPKKYELLGEIFERTKCFEPYIGGSMCQDVGIYYSQSSKYDFEDCGIKSNIRLDFFDRIPHLEAAKGAARVLKENHIPYGIVGNSNLKDLFKYQVLVLSNVFGIEEEEAKLIKEYVANGGSVYASGYTAPTLLADLFGIEYEGETAENVTYMSPTENGRKFMPDVTSRHPLTVYASQLKVKAINPDEVMAVITLPYTNPKDASKFASIHSNPPGIKTDYSSLIYRPYGKGKVIWSAAPIEEYNVDLHKKIFTNIVRTLSVKPFSYEVDAHPLVEAVVFHQPEKNCYTVRLINVQQVTPSLPVSGIIVKLGLNGRKADKVVLLPEGKELSFDIKEDSVIFNVPTLEIFHMILVEYR